METILPSFELIRAQTGNCQPVAIALAETGLPYRMDQIDLERANQYSSAHLALNPAGKMAALRVRSSGGEVALLQSNAFMLYLADCAPSVLLPVAALAFERFLYLVVDVIGVSHAGFSLRRKYMQQNASATAALEARALARIRLRANSSILRRSW